MATKKRFPGKALHRAALAIQEQMEGSSSVVSVGVGEKEMRGKLTTDIQCVKVCVRKKTGRPRRPVPESVRVQVDGRTYNIPTDVVEMRLSEQQWAQCGVVLNGTTVGAPAEGPPGTAGFVAKGLGNAEARYVVTAGHVLHDNSTSTAFMEEADMDNRVRKQFGKVTNSAYFLSAGIHDTGAFKVESRNDLSCLRAWPYDTVDSYWSLQELRGLHKLFSTVAYSGKLRSFEFLQVRFTTVWVTPKQFTFEDKGTVTYAPHLIEYRVTAPASELKGGFSGAPVVSSYGGVEKLVGIHVVADFDEHGRRTRGYCVAADIALRDLEQGLGMNPGEMSVARVT